MVLTGQSYLTVVNYYSKFPEVILLLNKTAGIAVAKIKALLAYLDIPKQLVCDHVPFASF